MHNRYLAIRKSLGNPLWALGWLIGLVALVLTLLLLSAGAAEGAADRDGAAGRDAQQGPAHAGAAAHASATWSSAVCPLEKHDANPILSPGTGGSWDDEDVWSPAVLEEGGAYRMWYTGYDGAPPYRIGLATSTDGITWTKAITANPVLTPTQAWETNGVAAGSVITDNGVLEMWYTGYDASWVTHVGYATSTDGITWTHYAGNPVLTIGGSGTWEDEIVGGPTVLEEDGTYHMWYDGHDGITSRIGHATSSDGIAWTRDPANPVLDIGEPGAWDCIDVFAPSVVTDSGRFVLLYSGRALPPAWQTGYAVSTDGSTWIRGDLLIEEGDGGDFDANGAVYASAIADAGRIKVWYTGRDAGGTYRIGYGRTCAIPSAYRVYLPLVAREQNATCSAYYTDDFGDSGSGWPVYDDSDIAYGYIDGMYRIWNKQASQGWAVTPGAKATDFTAVVSARRVGTIDGMYGIEFGINEGWSQFYQVAVDSSGLYSIWQYDSGWTALQNWTASGAINTGTAWNRLKVMRSGSQISFYVNDTLLATVSDATLTGVRRIGLVATAWSGGPVDTRFEDFALYPANCASAARSCFEMGRAEIRRAPDPPAPPAEP